MTRRSAYSPTPLAMYRSGASAAVCELAGLICEHCAMHAPSAPRCRATAGPARRDNSGRWTHACAVPSPDSPDSPDSTSFTARIIDCNAAPLWAVAREKGWIA